MADERSDDLPAGGHYGRRRDHGDRLAAPTRHLFNKLLGRLYRCVRDGLGFDEAQAFPAAVRDAAA